MVATNVRLKVVGELSESEQGAVPHHLRVTGYTAAHALKQHVQVLSAQTLRAAVCDHCQGEVATLDLVLKGRGRTYVLKRS